MKKEEKKSSTVKWVCGTILIIFFVSWATLATLPFSLAAVFSAITAEFLGSPPKKEQKVTYIPKHAPPPIKSFSQKKEKQPRYIYMIDLANGEMMKAKNVKRQGNMLLIENHSGLVMIISKSKIKDIKKIQL